MRLAFKAVMVVVLTLAILVPLTMVRGTINERQAYRQEAVEAVAQSYARAQGMAGPVLVVPYSEQVEVVEPDAQGCVGIRVLTTAICVGQTGVEMEALCAASAALLTIYDMCKAIDRGMRIENVQLDEKRGGKSGVWRREGASSKGAR